MLAFYDDTHEYRVDGVAVPSVSEIIRFLSREAYTSVSQWRMAEAADRGTRVHRCCEALDKQGACGAEDDIAGYVRAYAGFLEAHRVEWRGIEAALYHPQLLYAGTLDRYGTVDGMPVVVDIKTSAQPNFALVDAQLGGYGLLAASMGFTAQRHLCLHLRRDGSHRLIWHDTVPDLFLSCLDLHNALKPKTRRRALWNKTNRPKS